MRFFILLLIFATSLTITAQAENDSISVVEHYLEDQFYLGLSYNFIQSLPEGSNQRNLSYGLMGGFIKDVPLNKLKTFGVGVGVGVSINSYYSNIVAREAGSTISYDVENNIKRSKLETHLLEFPLELRWRTSTATDYKFWRIYAGVKGAYVLGARSKLQTEETKVGFVNTDVSPFQYGLSFSFGYNTFNLHVYYGLQDIFNGKASIDGSSLQYKPLRVGFIFYIL